MSRKKLSISEIFPGLPGRIKEIRKKLGSQEKLANLLGVQKPTISRYESGRVPDAETLKKIADIGNTTVEWLLRGEAPPDQVHQLREFAPEDYSATLTDIETIFLTEVITNVIEVIKARRLKLTAAQEARLIVKVYDDCRAAHEHPSIIHVEKILLLRD